MEPLVILVEQGCQTEDETKSSKNKKDDASTKLMLKETATGVKKDYSPGEEVPTGWQIIKAKIKSKEGLKKTTQSNTVSNNIHDTISSPRKSDLDEINNNDNILTLE